MKVYLGPYKNWIGPYQIADKVPFLSEESRDKLGDWLYSHEWINKLCEKIREWRGERTMKVRIDNYDTWSMDNTLAHIILPMLKQLKATKHGSGYVDDEDLPPEMRHDGEEWVHYKWDWVLNEMIWAFENIVDISWEEQFHHGDPKHIFEEVDTLDIDGVTETFHTMKQTNPEYWFDREGYMRYSKRIQNGTRLFGKYYQNLWD